MTKFFLIVFLIFKTMEGAGYTAEKIIEKDACEILETCLTFHHLNKHLSFSNGDTLHVVNKTKYVLKCREASFYTKNGARVSIRTVEQADSIMKLTNIDSLRGDYFTVTKINLSGSRKNKIVVYFQYRSYLSGFMKIEKKKNDYVVEKFEVGES